jgi:hypothetical protein
MGGRKIAFLGIAAAVGVAASLLTGATRHSAPSSASPPFTVGSTWRMGDGSEVKIQEVQGDWLRVTFAIQPGFAPAATWIYAPTGQVWRKY